MTIIGYTYQAENFTPDGLVAELVSAGTRAPGALGMGAEFVLDQWATETGLDREDEWSYDSENFPKVIDDDLTDVLVGETFRTQDGEYVDAHGNVVD